MIIVDLRLLRARAGTTAPFDGCKPSPYGAGEIAATTSSNNARHHRLARFSLILRCGSYPCTGPYRRTTGCRSGCHTIAPAHGKPLGARWEHLPHAVRAVANPAVTRVAVNGEWSTGSVELIDGDEVALVTPVSGG